MNINSVRDKERELIDAALPFINAGKIMVKHDTEKPPIINVSSYIQLSILHSELEVLREEEKRRFELIHKGRPVITGTEDEVSRLTEIAAQKATRCDELYEALEYAADLLFQSNDKELRDYGMTIRKLLEKETKK